MVSVYAIACMGTLLVYCGAKFGEFPEVLFYEVIAFVAISQGFRVNVHSALKFRPMV
jgi:hypothetical protein